MSDEFPEFFGVIPEIHDVIPEIPPIIPELDSYRTNRASTTFFAQSQSKGHRLSNKENTHWGKGGRDCEEKI